MKIYTKRGDQGETDLFGGARVSKSHIQVRAYGAIDSANSAIGMAYSIDGPEEIKHELLYIMKLMFSLGAEIATVNKESAKNLLNKNLTNIVNNKNIEYIEKLIDKIEEKLPELKSFVLPCGSDMGSRLHFARCMVRQAEIALIDLSEFQKSVRPEIIKFINRLSDLLFVMARFANYSLNIKDLLWHGKD